MLARSSAAGSRTSSTEEPGAPADPVHDHDHDHHDRPPPDPSLLEPLEGLELHVLRSVGIDIGSSTSHLVISRLVIRRRGSDLSSEFVVTEREIVYRSPIWLTPYRPGGATIDLDTLRERFEEAYRAGGVVPAEVDTGVVIVTGEALKKENAEQIARMLAAWSGRFICVSAGPNHEALLAAHGSGAVALSEAGRTVVNVDVGGGTTKVSVVVDGVVAHLEAFSIGARLLAFDEGGRIVRFEEPARLLLDRLGLDVGLGDPLSPGERARVGDLMAAVIEDLLEGGGGESSLYRELLMASDGRALPAPADVDHLVFSGGVSEFLSDDPPGGFGDLGLEFGKALRRRVAGSALAAKVHPARQGIRATVLGASQFTVQASGQTCFISDRDVLPVSGLRAVRLDFREGATEAVVRAALHRHDLVRWQGSLAAVVVLGPSPDYRALRGAAAAVGTVAARTGAELPLVVVLREDLAHAFGMLLREEIGWVGPIVVVDGITVDDLDYLDIGSPLGISGSVPVTVTSLEFPSSAGGDA